MPINFDLTDEQVTHLRRAIATIDEIAYPDVFGMIHRGTCRELGVDDLRVDLYAAADVRIEQLIEAANRHWGGLHALCKVLDNYFRDPRMQAVAATVLDQAGGHLKYHERRALIEIIATHDLEIAPGEDERLIHGLRVAPALAAYLPADIGPLLRRLDDAEHNELPAVIPAMHQLARIRPAARAALDRWVSDALQGRGRTEIDLAPYRYTTVYLTLMIQEAGHRSDPAPTGMTYEVSAWLDDGQARVLPKVTSPYRPTREEVARIGAGLISQLAPQAGALEADKIQIEAYLPTPLLDLNVERWRLGPATVAGTIGVDHPVVIRSLDRLSYKLERAEWRRRWEQRNSGGRAYWLHRNLAVHQIQPSGGDDIDTSGYTDTDQLLRPLRRARNLSCAGGCCLGRRPAADAHSGGVDALGVAVLAGAPIGVWSRASAGETELRELTTGLFAAADIDALPDRALQTRQDANGDRADWREDFVVLWDDPDRVLVETRDILPTITGME